MTTKGQTKSHRLNAKLMKVIAQHRGVDYQPFPSIRQVAREHNVSLITANKVISNLMAQGFLVKREGIGTFVAPKQRVSSATNADDVALCLGPTTFSNFFLSVFSELNNQAREHGIRLSIFSDGNPVAGHYRQFIRSALDAGFETILLGPVNRAELVGVEDLLQEAKRVILFGTEEELGFSTTGIDVFRGTFLAGKYFAQMGHRRILFLRPHLPARTRGFMHGLAEEGVDLPDELVVPCDGTERSSYDIINNAIQSGLNFTSVMTCSDEATLGVMFALHGHKRRVPEDVSVISFGDAAPVGAICPVTSISVRPGDLALETIKMVNEILRGDTGDLRHEWVEPVLIDRGSVKVIDPDQSP